MSGRELRVGVIGCGRLVERGYVPAARRADDIVLAAVADVDIDRCARIAPGIPAFRSVEALLAGSDVDALVVATPPAAHMGPARAAARAGVPTIVEKPPAANVDEARELAALKRPPWIGFNRRFLLGLSEGRAKVRARATVLELEFHYRRAAWQPYTPAPDALLDAASHLVDLARWLTGAEIRRVRALSLTPERGYAVLELGRVLAHLGWAVDRPHRERIEARDAQGGRLLRYADGGLLRALARRSRQPSETNPFVNSLARQLEALAQELRGDSGGGLATADDGLKVMQGLAAVKASAAQDGVWQSPSV